MLWLVGLFTASLLTLVGAKFFDRVGPNWPLPLRLSLASLAAPFHFALLILVAVLDSLSTAKPERLRSLYMDVVPGIALKLWLWSALCAGFLWLIRKRSASTTTNSPGGLVILWCVTVLCASLLMLMVGMGVWIGTGGLGGMGVIYMLTSGFAVGFVPAAVTSAVLLFQFRGRLRRWADPVLASYVAILAVGGVLWRILETGRPGDWSVLVVTTAALVGAFIVWLWTHRALLRAREKVASHYPN
jgi:hypothetical protein